VLPVLLFILFWVVVALGMFFVASRGGIGPARETLHTQTSGGRMAINVVLVVVYVGFGIALPLALLIGNHKNASAKVGNITLNADQKAGRTLFGEHCGQCHTLAATNSIAKVGPNLDTLKPPYSLVLHTIQYGCLQSPLLTSSPLTCLGYGTMPADVVQGKEARQVASFVAKVAGRE
jgi:mono/diheme cytochrome c family protein